MPNSHSPRRQTNPWKIYAHHTKKGPRRYHRQGTPGKPQLPQDAEDRNPFTVHTRTMHDQHGAYDVHKVTLDPVRMKMPRLRRAKRIR